ncbi:hypothetical protein [Ahrensia sp. R2A130]|uniref:hypothetical protein n=1 Tax=Ahrensia sp. R2A130 TaxID=744979 RepID=UPI000590F3A5|nr:hypothetical protein [Ahrensia sp. R2A130]
MTAMIENKNATVSGIARNTSVGRDKVKSFVGVPGIRGDGVLRATADLRASELIKLFEFIESVDMLAENSQFTLAERAMYVELVRSASITRSDSPDHALYPFEITSMIESHLPLQDEIDKIEGRYVSFRRLPNDDHVYVSAIDVVYDEDRRILTWSNVHSVYESEPFQFYYGVIVPFGSDYLFFGRRRDRRYINILSIRKPSDDRPYRHGICLVESDDTPTLARLFLRKIDCDDEWKTIKKQSGRKSIDICLGELGLTKEEFIDPLPWMSEDGGKINNKNSIISRKYSID